MRPKARLQSTLLAALWLLASSCATTTNPVTGERELVGISTQQEIAMGTKAAEQVQQQMGLVDDPALRGYIRQLGARLAPYSPRRDLPYSFDVVLMPEPNAFALPGGHIYVSRGLLAITNSEAELAGVIGHEIGHVAARHHAQRQTRSQAVGAATVLGTLAAAVLGGGQAAQAVNELGQVAGSGLIASYGRDQERQSDDVGQRIAAKAGYDPAGISVFLDTLGRASELETGQKRQPSFFDSHPSTPERVRDTKTRAASLRAAAMPAIAASPAIAGSRRAFYEHLRGLLVGPDPASGIFVGQRFLHPDLDLAIDFPSGWKTVNAQSSVGAQHPQGTGFVRLQSQGAGSDVRAAANAFANQAKLALQQSQEIRIAGRPAWRALAQTQDGTAVQFTWIARGGSIYRVEGVAKSAGFNALAASFDRVARSVRGLQSSERNGIRERRLEVATARAGETLVQLGKRTGNAWGPKETAIANGVPLNVRFRAGDPVKIAKERPYRGR